MENARNSKSLKLLLFSMIHVINDVHTSWYHSVPPLMHTYDCIMKPKTHTHINFSWTLEPFKQFESLATPHFVCHKSLKLNVIVGRLERVMAKIHTPNSLGIIVHCFNNAPTASTWWKWKYNRQSRNQGHFLANKTVTKSQPRDCLYKSSSSKSQTAQQKCCNLFFFLYVWRE